MRARENKYIREWLGWDRRGLVCRRTGGRDLWLGLHWGRRRVVCRFCGRYEYSPFERAGKVKGARAVFTYLCQCFTMASVESIIVPSKSVNTPSTSRICGGAEKFAESSEGAMMTTGNTISGSLASSRVLL